QDRRHNHCIHLVLHPIKSSHRERASNASFSSSVSSQSRDAGAQQAADPGGVRQGPMCRWRELKEESERMVAEDQGKDPVALKILGLLSQVLQSFLSDRDMAYLRRYIYIPQNRKHDNRSHQPIRP
ncbi:hypothetical protein BC938DRAFT_474054, partial [Jimgerdemannia flammicorona]